MSQSYQINSGVLLPVSVFPYYDWKVNLLCNCILSHLCSKDFVYIQSFNKYLFSNYHVPSPGFGPELGSGSVAVTEQIKIPCPRFTF